ncbi:hypothetical protein PPTG_22201 [Phytophthora nicotianae INRA-310]|uniref:MULE transposase domain-containing protein n=1 Tax=Phytophthora nicotianae (strain INRA-310) TaxID=761204 RepID=W2QLV7_PHYN3|nr:hypothetical protein PPTG_22201 [Phytophthora nicotianae INRA-310]ETN14123.1 hypothetical protein PPTG_22201 [Phytophthora nicotianae INRA-310]
MKATLRIDAVMGDAEAAQLNGLVKIAGFGNSKYLMCFFHVLYNVRKRIRHLPDLTRAVVYRGILDMHYSLSEEELKSVWSRVMNEWRRDSRLRDFADYFYSQWL